MGLPVSRSLKFFGKGKAIIKPIVGGGVKLFLKLFLFLEKAPWEATTAATTTAAEEGRVNFFFAKKMPLF